MGPLGIGEKRGEVPWRGTLVQHRQPGLALGIQAAWRDQRQRAGARLFTVLAVDLEENRNAWRIHAFSVGRPARRTLMQIKRPETKFTRAWAGRTSARVR